MLRDFLSILREIGSILATSVQFSATFSPFSRLRFLSPRLSFLSRDFGSLLREFLSFLATLVQFSATFFPFPRLRFNSSRLPFLSRDSQQQQSLLHNSRRNNQPILVFNFEEINAGEKT